ncbi:hypothetical protein OPT61_g3188 [Boeremia exigua]|uniref:Uncharacterized protein n=1 Tax=Boeremia exigua TaxID=749465 RepID=A0ACC2IIT7_9PLEO|nr:hypothetical protein OPT61_g3188 [Boeremia exigua]
MPFLDVCHLFFNPGVTIEDEASIFGQEWRMTVKYVLSQAGLKAGYTSRLTSEHDLWFFLIWETEDSRRQYYHQTTGFGFVSQRMARLPNMFFFGNASYQELDKTSAWTIDVLGAEMKDVSDPKHTQDLERRSGVHEQQFVELLDQHNFVARQKGAELENLYQSNDFGDAFVGLVSSDLRRDQDSRDGFRWDRFSVELQKCEPSPYPSCTQVDVPVDIADLTGRQPWEYGVLRYDDSEYSDTAYPMDLNFRPMSTIGMANKFVAESDHQQIEQSKADNGYTMCIISLSAEFSHLNNDSRDEIDDLREEIGLQDGIQGLRELSILRMTGSQTERQNVRLLCAWNTTSDLESWRQDPAFQVRCNVDSIWTSDDTGLSKLAWEDMPLTVDKQSWQHVDKILEIINFTFTRDLSTAEREAFQHRACALTNTMSSCWSGDIDERPVVYAEDPIWTQYDGAGTSCILLLAWDGVSQRRAWLRNFMANGFVWTGHLAHVLGAVCPHVHSGTYSMVKVYTYGGAHDAPPDIEDENDAGDDSDRDMGF